MSLSCSCGTSTIECKLGAGTHKHPSKLNTLVLIDTLEAALSNLDLTSPGLSGSLEDARFKVPRDASALPSTPMSELFAQLDREILAQPQHSFESWNPIGEQMDYHATPPLFPRRNPNKTASKDAAAAQNPDVSRLFTQKSTVTSHTSAKSRPSITAGPDIKNVGRRSEGLRKRKLDAE